MEGARARSDVRDEELARAVLPVLLGRIAASTERLQALERGLKGAARPTADRETDLTAEAREADTLGWLLGCVAGGLGAELLLDRHEPRALELALELVDEALAVDGQRLAPAEIPRVTPHGGWRLAWALAGLLWRAGRAAPGETELAFTITVDAQAARLALSSPLGGAVRQRAETLACDLPSTRLEPAGVGWSWSFPAAWLETPA